MAQALLELLRKLDEHSLLDEEEKETLSILEEIETIKGSRPKRIRTVGRIPRTWGNGLEFLTSGSDTEFRSTFRMERANFYRLFELFRLKIETRCGLVNQSSNFGCINPLVRFAATLRWLAGGSHLDLCVCYEIPHGSFYPDCGILWPTIAAIDEVLDLYFPLQEPENLEAISEGFSELNSANIKGCVMAIDGLVSTRCPKESETENVKCFRNRKGCWGYNMHGWM